MNSGIKLKESFEVEAKYGAFYTGGNIEWHGDHLYCQTSSSISILDTDSGNVKTSIGDDSSEEPDVIQTFTSDGERLVTSHKNGLLKLWNLEGELLKMWKCIHQGPIARLVVKEEKLASGGSDGVVRLWDLARQACILSLKGAQGVINVVKFKPADNMIFASGDDGKIVCWELSKGRVVQTYSAHFSKVIEIVFVHDGVHFVSLGRDKVLVLWSFENAASLRIVPVFEAIESIVALPRKFRLPTCKASPESVYVAAAGEKGIIRVFDLLTSNEIYTQTNSLVSAADEGGLSVTRLLFKEETKQIAVVTAEHNIIIHNLKTFVSLKQFVGFSDEILDVTFFGKDDTHLAVATNSVDIKLYENITMNCQLLKGHTDIVLALNTSSSNPNLLMSSGKDNSIRLWLLSEGLVTCVGIGLRHTGSVSSVAFPKTSTNFAVSVSQDMCVKLWEIPTKFKGNASLNCTGTEVAHKKDINCVVVAPNDKLIATCSQDKTVKLWSDTLGALGVLRGHKRSVWCARFSPVDQVLMTSSADCTIRLWSINNLNCLKVLEGHESSVLRVEFLTGGMQILSAGADGLLKLFSLKTSQCTATFNEHEGRIWAMAVKKDESAIVTGGSDSLLLRWKDVTEEKKLEKVKELEELALQEQQLSNYLHSDRLMDALKLALRLDRPLQVLRIIQTVTDKGNEGLAGTIGKLRQDQKESLMEYAIVWNSNNKNCHAAQMVIKILIDEMQTGQFKPNNLSKNIENILPYTERQFRRVTQLMQDLYFGNYTVNIMQPHAKPLS